MREFDRTGRRPTTAGVARLNDPAMLICAALMLAMIVLTMRIISIW